MMKALAVGMIGALFVVDVPVASAQTQTRNFNLSCGLIGKFVRHPPHLQHCRAVLACDDPQLCSKRKAGKRKTEALQLTLSAPILKEENPDEIPTNPESEASNTEGGLGARVNAEGSVSGGSVSAGAEAGASVGSGSGGMGGASAGAGASVGGVGGSIGGGLGVGGL